MRLALVSGAVALALGAGCTVGSGAGSAIGPLYVVSCNTSGGPNNLGSFAMPACFNLQPTFFAGNPTEDLPNSQMPENRLTIRMQTNGNSVTGAYNNIIYGSDVFFVDVLNAFQVARCLRGQCNADGTPDWDTRNVADLHGGFTNIPWCDWGPNPCAGIVDAGVGDAGARLPEAGVPDAALADNPSPFVDGGPLGTGPPFMQSAEAIACAATGATAAATRTQVRPLIHLGPLEYVTASLTPFGTCPTARLTGTAVEGWIDFINFGQATTVAVLQPDFKVNFGERLQASFHAVLQDDRVVQQTNMLVMVDPPQIGGSLDGFFDFILDRGRAAQPFP